MAVDLCTRFVSPNLSLTVLLKYLKEREEDYQCDFLFVIIDIRIWVCRTTINTMPLTRTNASGIHFIRIVSCCTSL